MRLLFLIAVGIAGFVCQAREVVVLEKTGAAIQRAIDAVAKEGGGRVTLTNGLYESATIYLRSGVDLHLTKNAVLRGSALPDDYDDIDDPRIKKAPERSKKAFLVCLGGENVSITGEGAIDGQGPLFYDRNVPPGEHFRKPAHPRTRMVQFWGCRKIRFSGVTFKDSPGWTFWLRMCEDIDVRGITIVGDQRMINNDGIHFDGCKRMRVADSTIVTGDDCIVMRANRSPDGDSDLCEDLEVVNCSLDSSCQAIRLGCPSDGTIRNGYFHKLCITGNNGILSQHPLHYLQEGTRGSCRMSNLVIEDCVIFVRGSPIFFNVEPSITLGEFGNVTLKNLRIEATKPIVLKGTAETPLVNMRLEDITGRIAAPNPLEVQSVTNLVLTNVQLSSGPTRMTPFTWGWKSSSWESIP